MKEYLTSFFCIFILFSLSISAQDQKVDPLSGNYMIGNNAEIIAIHGTTLPGDCFHSLYEYTGTDIVLQDQLTFNGTYQIAGKASTDVIVADFNNDGYDDYVAAWQGPDSSIILHAQSVIENSITGNPSHTSIIGTGVLHGNMRLLAVELDTIPGKEFILAYADFSNTVHIEVYRFDGSMEPQLVTSISDATADTSKYVGPNFNITQGDFDHDGLDELFLVTMEKIPDNYNFNCRYYNYDWEFNSISSGDEKTFYSFQDSIILGYQSVVYHEYELIGLTTGDFDNDANDDLAFGLGFSYENGIGPGTNDDTVTYYGAVAPMFPDMENDSILNHGFTFISHAIAGYGNLLLNDISDYRGSSFSIGSFDLNNDSKDEIVSNFNGNISITVLRDTLGGYHYFIANSNKYTNSTEPYEWFNSTRNVFGIDLDADTLNSDWGAEIVALKPNQFINIYDSNLVNDTIGDIWNPDIHVNKSLGVVVAIGAGDFDNDAIKFGPPKHQTITDLVHPLVILNSPPVHYDILDTTTLDMAECFDAPSGCASFTSYTMKAGESSALSSEMHRDWGVSAEISGGVDFLGVSVSASLKNSYGEKFSKVSSSSSSIEEASNKTVKSVDYIYAVWSNYDLWEYPVYFGGELQGYTMVTDPAVSSRGWREVADLPTGVYAPLHETGNIMSYPTRSQLESYIASGGSVIRQGDFFEVAVGASDSWEININDFSGEEVKSSWENTVEAGASIGYGGVKAEINGEFTVGELSSFSSEATNGIELDVNMAELLGTYTFGNYEVYPYYYWAPSGAVVVDFAVNPIGDIWDFHYSDLPDLAFILPYRYHIEKGQSLYPDPTKKYLTPSITIKPRDPAPLDTVTISGFIQNFSLLNTYSEIPFKLYLTDPDSCSNPMQIFDTNGDSVFTITGGINTRDRKQFNISWEVPADIPQDFRIYGLIDPENTIDEIHTNNNKGYAQIYLPEGSLVSDYGCLNCCTNPTGDINNDGGATADISDLLYLVDFMFVPGSPGLVCPEEGDVNGDGGPVPDISDLLYLVDYMFVPGSDAPADCQ